MTSIQTKEISGEKQEFKKFYRPRGGGPRGPKGREISDEKQEFKKFYRPRGGGPRGPKGR